MRNKQVVLFDEEATELAAAAVEWVTERYDYHHRDIADALDFAQGWTTGSWLTVLNAHWKKADQPYSLKTPLDRPLCQRAVEILREWAEEEQREQAATTP